MKTKISPKLTKSLLAFLLAALMLLSVCPISAFAGSNAPTTTTVPTATAYCHRYASCDVAGKQHSINNCPGPQRLTNTRGNARIGGVDYTVAATKPTTTSPTTVTITAANKDSYTYTVSADNTTITERKNGTVTRTANVADYVSAADTVHATKNKKPDGIFKYQANGSDSTTKMNIWINDGTKTPITRTNANTSDYFAYQTAVDGNRKAVNSAITWGVGGGLALVALGVATFATAGLAGPAAAAIGAKIGAMVIGVSSAAGGIAGSGFVNALEKCNTTYADAKKYYYILKG